MQTSTTRLEKPLYLWLARIVALGFILTSIGIGVSSLPDVLDKLEHRGAVKDVIWWPDQNGEAIVNRVSSAAEQKGVAIGDKVLNADQEIGGLGTPVTLQIQRGNSPARDFTFLRGPASAVVYGGVQLGLPLGASVMVAFLFTLVPLIVGAMGSLLLYFLRSNDWMALFTAMVLANFGTAASSEFPPSNPVIIIFNRLMLFLTFFWILVFPNGRLLPRWSWAYSLLLLPSFIIQSAIDLGLLGQTEHGFTSLTYMAMLALFSTLYFRYDDTFSLAERQQTKWVITPAIAGLVSIGLIYSASIYAPTYEGVAIGYFFNSFVRTVFLLSLAVGIFFSILRYRLWEIDIIINRALVYGSLTAIVIGVYVLIVGGLGTAIQGRNNLLVSILATGLVAVLVQPLRDRLQRGVNRLMYGERDDPVTVLSRLGQRLEGTLAPDAVLPSLVETVAQTLKLPYVAIMAGNDSSPTTTYGKPQAEVIRLPLIYQAETIGQLLVAPRAQGEELNPMDRHLLENIAHQAGMAVHAVNLNSDLQQSRQQLVTTREEERRRLRRDLHDGLGPNLASQGLKLAAVRQLLESDPVSALPLLDQVMGQNQATVGEVRRLVYGLRPPALDELGLVAAIRDHIAGMEGKSALQIEITEPQNGLPSLSAAVEVAAYRIVLEALTNVIRHAQAQHCDIRFSVVENNLGSVLQIEIKDDGKGMPEVYRAGIGLRSMRERAEELGGTYFVESPSKAGTSIRVQLPLGNDSKS